MKALRVNTRLKLSNNPTALLINILTQYIKDKSYVRHNKQIPRFSFARKDKP